jgi:hypothetical protein
MDLHELFDALKAANELEVQAKKMKAQASIKMLDSIGTRMQATSLYSYRADPGALMMATMSWPTEIQPAYLGPVLDEDRIRKIRQEMPLLWQQIEHLVEIEFKEVKISFCLE